MPFRQTEYPLVAEHEFVCGLCRSFAGIVRLFRAADSGEIERVSFTSELTGVVGASAIEDLQAAILLGDAKRLYRLDLEYAPFYCPVCDACFCGAHWAKWDVFDEDGWHDSIRGLCPHGHERMLED